MFIRDLPWWVPRDGFWGEAIVSDDKEQVW